MSRLHEWLMTPLRPGRAPLARRQRAVVALLGVFLGLPVVLGSGGLGSWSPGLAQSVMVARSESAAAQDSDGTSDHLIALGEVLGQGRQVLLRESVATRETAVHATVPALASAGVAPRAAWQWPLPGRPEVVKHFDPPEQRWLPGHRGIDLAGMTYTPVLAVADGTVSYSGSIAGIGIVSVTHQEGIRSTYQPVVERIEEGESVSAGDRIGDLGAVGSHCLLRTCLHLGAVRDKDHYVDPLLFLAPWELTLLPHGR